MKRATPPTRKSDRESPTAGQTTLCVKSAVESEPVVCQGALELMPPRVVPFTIPVTLLLASCAFATSDAGLGEGHSDARVRADADPSLPVADAAQAASPDAGLDAAVTTVDATPPSADAVPAVTVLVISEIVDADLTGGLPKFVELTNLGTGTLDLSEFSIGVFSNGSFTINSGASTTLDGTLAPEASYVVSFETGDAAGSSSFRTVYGFDADHLGFNAVINGNDTIVLFLGAATGNGSDATIVDIYGLIGTDGTGEAWEYLDGFATRRAAADTPSPVFTAGDWVFSGVSALDGADAPGIAAATSPGTH
ncbi:MAG: lamin tail domain-containing protein [Myxococcales bacterium]|nr:lamin tail domain-containing protein [Myxococcales bacterium]